MYWRGPVGAEIWWVAWSDFASAFSAQFGAAFEFRFGANVGCSSVGLVQRCLIWCSIVCTKLVRMGSTSRLVVRCIRRWTKWRFRT